MVAIRPLLPKPSKRECSRTPGFSVPEYQAFVAARGGVLASAVAIAEISGFMK